MKNGVDAYVTVDLPDNVAAAAMALAVSQGNGDGEDGQADDA
jgi:hypothetical protein